MNGAMNIGSRYIGSIVMFLNMMKVFVIYKESAISSSSVRGRVWGTNCYGSCGFPSIDWHGVLSDIHHSCFDPPDVHRTGSPGPKSGRLES